ncbi:MAG: DUF502 domain-containing protein [Planctomycetia bacterium]|nr:DUF502 domain-containing protein [Planctomycetia bacterium]
MKTSLIKQLFRYFLSGVLFILPFVVTVAIVAWCSNFFITWFGPETVTGRMLSAIGIRFSSGGVLAYLFGWLIVLFIVFALGVFVDVITRKMAVHWFDALIKRIPIVGPIYGTARQFTDLMNKDGNQDMKNMLPVYCRFGSAPGSLFLALMPNGNVYEIAGGRYNLVIIPTAPVPFGGAMVYVPCDDVVPAEMSIESLISLYVSMGVTSKK